MIKPYVFVLFAAFRTTSAFAQIAADTVANRSVALQEFVVGNRALKTYTHRARAPIRSHEHFTARSEKRFSIADSFFMLTPVPALHTGAIRLRNVTLRTDRWDTSRLRLNLMVLQIHHGDTSFSIFPLPMKVRKSRLHVKFPGAGLGIRPDTFYIGYSVAAFHVPEVTRFRQYSRESPAAVWAQIQGAALRFSGDCKSCHIIPVELGYEEL